MKKTVFSVLICMLLLPLAGLEITGESGGPPVSCGSLLFIQLQEPAQVYLNSKLRGTTPLLLSGLKGGRYTLRIEGKKDFHETTVNINPDITALTTYIPQLEPYSGRLSLTSDPADIDVWDNGAFLGTTPLAGIKLKEGKHQLKFYYPGYSIQEQELNIRRGESESLNIRLEALLRINVLPPLEGKMQLVCENETQSLTFLATEEVLLSRGSWNITLSGPGIVTGSREIMLEKDQDVDFDPVYFDPCLVFSDLRPGSLIFVDSKEVTAAVQKNKYLLPAGKHMLNVRLVPYLDFRQSVNVQEDRETLVKILYLEDPLYGKARRKKAGWITFSVGAAVSVISLIFNYDPIAVDLSAENYATYNLIKYGSLGGLGIGALGMGVGLIMLN